MAINKTLPIILQLHNEDKDTTFLTCIDLNTEEYWGDISIEHDEKKNIQIYYGNDTDGYLKVTKIYNYNEIYNEKLHNNVCEEIDVIEFTKQYLVRLYYFLSGCTTQDIKDGFNRFGLDVLEIPTYLNNI